MAQLYAMHDSDLALKRRGAFKVTRSEAIHLQVEGYGIFVAVNEFKDGIRKVENLTKINAWAIDIDSGSKNDMISRLKKGPIPSLVVETKRGYQAYWQAKDATPEAWNSIQVDRLVPFYGADANARDLARILRMPGFYHMKDPKNPFLVQKVWQWPVSYNEQDFLDFFPDANKNQREVKAFKQMQYETREIKTQGSNFWDKVYNLNCEQALYRLSGKACVNFEIFTFKQNRSGTKNILANNKPTSCWIDLNGRIGSFDKGGPTIYQWLRWYNHHPKDVYQIIKQEFPECLI